jgi:ATP-dependent exoDNAse (exonuclease V) beta subunit
MLKIYRSSAGSGKTFTLVKEYLRICFESKDINKYKHILGITFTNKAAQEMKERIIYTINDFSNDGVKETDMLNLLSKETSISKEDIIAYSSRLINKILQDYSTFSIITIDSFTHKVIRSFAYELDLPHNFEVLIDRDEFKNLIVENLLSNISEDENDDLSNALIQLAEEKLDDGKGWNIDYGIKEFIDKMLADDSYPFLVKASKLKVDDVKAFINKIKLSNKTFEDKIEEIGTKAIALIEKNGLDSSYFYQGKNGIYNHFKKLANFKIKFDVSKNSHVVKTIEEDLWLSKKAPANAESIIIELKNLIYQANEIEKNAMSDYIIYKSVLKSISLFKIINSINTAIENVKSEGNILPIEQFQSLVSSVVSTQDAPIIYERIGEKYDSILIDEFQDTSLLQFRNIIPLIENCQYKSEDSLIVGDAKQSIYRFKGAEGEQLVNLPKIYGSDKNTLLKEREIAINNYPTKSLVLNQNFRSLSNIIKFNNFFYEILKKENDLLEEIYNQHEQELDKNKIGGYVYIQKNKNEENDIENNIDTIVEFIKEALSDEYETGDIAILTRNNENGKEIAASLLNKGFSVETSESVLLIQNENILFIESLLNYIKNPQNKIAKQLIIQHLDKNNSLSYLENKQLLHSTQISFDQYISNMIHSSLDSFLLYHNEINILLDKIIAIFKIPSTNVFINGFIDAVLDFSSRNSKNLSNFLIWWETEREKRSIDNASNNSAIKIMTIHKSKGLQFPVVIIPEGSWKIKNTKEYAWIEDENNFEINPLLVKLDKSILETNYKDYLINETNKSIIDNVNLMYVATTRPQERLYILYSENKSKKENNENAKNTSHLFDFIVTYSDEIYSYTLGERNKKVLKKKNSSHMSTTTIIESINFGANEYSFKAINNNAESDEIEYGNLLHEYLNTAAKKSFIDIYNKLNESKLDNKLIERLKEDLCFIESNNILNKLYSQDYERYAEVEFLNENKVLKPDLIAKNLKDNTFTIIDFKTGKKDKKHIDQVNEYKIILEKGGRVMSNVIIVYTLSKELVLVNKHDKP